MDLKEKIGQNSEKESNLIAKSNKRIPVLDKSGTESDNNYLIKDVSKEKIENKQKTSKPENKGKSGESFYNGSNKIENTSAQIINDDKTDLNIEDIIENEELDIDNVEERKKPKKKYQLPSSDLLANPVAVSDTLNRDELVDRANYLTQSMSTFGVEGKVVNVHPGPGHNTF